MQSVANVLGTAADRADAGRRVRAVRETDRRRIARDLQEEALRDVTELLAETERGRASGVVPGPGIPPADVPGVLRGVAEQLRSAIHDLRLGGDEDRPFLELVQDLVAVHQAAATDASVDLHVRDGIVPDSLGARGTEVLRILGEALTNARRHSGARRITVELRGLADGVQATVADDGRGFADRGPATDGDRHGLRAMRERAELAGARLEIGSEVGLGTEVRVHLPVAPWSEGPSASVRVLLPMEEIVALLRHAGRQREQEADDRAAIEQLTPRELELLQALAEGLDGGAIAERLHISRRTERNHFTNILNKLGVHSRLQALVLALRYDVVRITPWPPVP
jgi:DNA-binding CsgD family transcriptional regulator/nucleotide-binding universal stress UspA family protein